jgi:hypothetical protein
MAKKTRAERVAEYTDLSDDQRRALRTYLDGMEISKEYVKPYFEKFVRHFRLFNGVLPPELDGTFSKIMLNLGFSMVDNEMPRSLRALLGTTDWFSTTANDPSLEEFAPLTRKWLAYQMEYVQRISQSIIPSVQSAHICGTGYRVYGCRMIPKVQKRRIPSEYAMGIPIGYADQIETTPRYVIGGQDVNVFNIWPLPGGGTINSFDDSQATSTDGLIWQSFMTKAEIEANVKNEQWDGRQAQSLFDKQVSGDKADPADEYKSQVSDSAIGWHSFTSPSWMERMRSESKDLPCRYRVAWFFMRDKWIVIGEDRFVLYDGEPGLPFIPVAKFMSSYNLSEWFGKGLIEIVEDLILTTTVLINHRMDYLASTLHPTTYVSERVMEFLGGDKTQLDPEPYKVLTFPTNATISNEIVRERFHEISQQAFYEDNQMGMWMQKIGGQPDLMKGVAGPGTPDAGATGVMSLIQEGTARSMMRAANIEESGIRDSLNITLRLGSIYNVIQDSWVRTGGNGGFAWEKIPPEAIGEDYRIGVSGTRSMTAADQTFRKMIQVAQIALTLPPGIVDNPKAMMKQLIDKSAAFDDVQEIVGSGQQASSMLPMMAGMPAAGGQTDMENEMRSVNNRNEMTPSGISPVTGELPI